MIELDPRPARQLTSREIAKLVASLLGYSIGAALGSKPDQTQDELLERARSGLQTATEIYTVGHPDQVTDWATRAPLEAMMFMPVIALVSDTDICGREETLQALRWLVEEPHALPTLCASVCGQFSAHRDVYDRVMGEIKAQQS